MCTCVSFCFLCVRVMLYLIILLLLSDTLGGVSGSARCWCFYDDTCFLVQIFMSVVLIVVYVRVFFHSGFVALSPGSLSLLL